MGTELRARYLDAGAIGGAQLSERSGGVARRRRPRVARCRRADRGGGAVHVDRHHADEPPALGARPRSRVRRDSDAARALGQSACGPHDAECAGDHAVHLVAAWSGGASLTPGRFYFWGARALYLGPGLPATVLSHHAVQVCIPLSGTVRLRTGARAEWRHYEG